MNTHSTTSNEGWQPVRGWEGFYEVSQGGEVRSVGGRGVGTWASRGYVYCRLSRPRKVVLVHRLVAQAFISNPDGRGTVNHIDNDPSNNAAANLEWCSQAENIAHMDRQGRRAKVWLGKRSPNARLADDDVRELRRTREAGKSFQNLGAQFRISKRAAERCAKGETYSDVR